MIYQQSYEYSYDLWAVLQQTEIVEPAERTCVLVFNVNYESLSLSLTIHHSVIFHHTFFCLDHCTSAEVNFRLKQTKFWIFNGRYKYWAAGSSSVSTFLEVILSTTMSKSSTMLFLVVVVSCLVCVQSQSIFFGGCPSVNVVPNFDANKVFILDSWC